MALSNIFREPRREITETVVGVVCAAMVCYGIHALALRLVLPWSCTKDCGGDLLLAHLLALVMAFAAVCSILVIHEIGEGICNFLGRHGIQLRPTRRY